MAALFILQYHYIILYIFTCVYLRIGFNDFLINLVK